MELYTSSVPRRAVLFMPFAFAGLMAVSSRKSAARTTAGEVTLMLFDDNGKPKGKAKVAKVVKTDAEWRKQLTPEEYTVTRHAGTERPFSGKYDKNHAAGMYRCVCCGNALFRSDEKFDSGTGWPSFWAPIAKENVTEEKDTRLFMQRTEVLCSECDAHLGHLFDDGPKPTGLRYCMNSAALRFTPKEDHGR